MPRSSVGTGPAGQFAGKPLSSMLWDKVEELTIAAMADVATTEDKAKAKGAIELLAVFINPYKPDPKKIRQEAKRRARFRSE